MLLFKGSKLNMNPFQPQTVQSDDFHKFPQPIPKSVIFASNSETKAKIFAVFSTIIPFKIESSSDNSQISVIMEDEIIPETLKEKVYLYKFDSDKRSWKPIEETSEWYSTEEQIPIEITEYTREELYNELRENSEISLKKEFQEKERTTTS